MLVIVFVIVHGDRLRRQILSHLNGFGRVAGGKFNERWLGHFLYDSPEDTLVICSNSI